MHACPHACGFPVPSCDSGMGMCVDTQAVTRLCHVSVIQVPCPCNITQSHTDMSVHPCSVPRHHHIMVLACLFTYMLCPSTTAAEAEACLCTYMPYPGTVLYVHGHSCSHACAHSAPFCVHTEAKSVLSCRHPCSHILCVPQHHILV